MTQFHPAPRMRKNRRSLMLFLCALTIIGALCAVHVATVLAQEPQVIPESGTIGSCSFVTGDFTFDCIPLYLTYLIRIVFGIAGTLAVIQVIWGGYEYALSGAQEITGIDKEQPKKRIRNALIGLGAVVLSYLIVDTIISALFS